MSRAAVLPASPAMNRAACRITAAFVGFHVMIRDLSGVVMPFERVEPSEPCRNGA
jgi:hypothetical protein